MYRRILIAMVSACLAAFGGLTAAQAEAPEELVFVNYRDIRDLNPHLYAGEMYAQELLYETLVSIGPNGYEPCLAESWEVSPDGRVYTFHIRPGVTFSDGEKCDAFAILKNFEAVIVDNGSRHTWLEMVRLFDSMEAPDESTFIIRMKEPYWPMLTELGVTRPFAMLSPKAMQDDGSTKNGVKAFIGTGPYVLTEVVTDEYAVFERNENYWGEKPAIQRILVKVIPDNQTRILALEKGEVDLIFGKNMLDADAMRKYQNSDKFTAAISEATSTRQIVLNSTRGALTDVRVRQALQHATDRQTISEGIFYGFEPPAPTLFSRTVPYCDIDLKPYEYDPQRAAELLEEAGWTMQGRNRQKDGQPLVLDLLYNSDSVTEKTIAEYLQSEFGNLGIRVTIHGEEEQSYRDKMKSGEFDMVFNICWGMPYDPQSSLAAMRQRVYGDYAAQLGLPDKAQIDQAITDIMVSTDPEARQELFTFVLTRLHEEAAYIPLTYETNKAIFRSDLEGVRFCPSQYEIPFWEMRFQQ